MNPENVALFPEVGEGSFRLKRFSGVYLCRGEIRQLTFEARDAAEARELAERWNIGVEGESDVADEISRFVPSLEVPEAYEVKDACRLLGNISRVTLYRWIVLKRLRRVGRTRKVLVTRESIISLVAQKS